MARGVHIVEDMHVQIETKFLPFLAMHSDLALNHLHSPLQSNEPRPSGQLAQLLAI